MALFLQHVIDAITYGSQFALYALGIALIFGIMGLINFAHGELIMVGAYTIILIGQPPWPVVVIATIAVAIVFALGMERVAFRPLRSANPSTLLIASFAVSYGLQNLAILIEGSAPQGTSVSTWLSESVQIGSVSIPKLDVVTIGVTLVLLVALGLFLQRTRMGVQMRAAAEDFRMARILGVKANTVIATAFAMSGLLAGIGAYLLVAQTGEVAPDIGTNPVLYAFVATVLGGMGSLRGAVLGGYVFGAIFVGLQAYLPLELRSYRDAFAFAAVIVMLLVRPQGLDRRQVDGDPRLMLGRAVLTGIRAVWPLPALLVLVVLAAEIVWATSGPVTKGVVVVALINLILVVGLYVFVGNSGVFSFGSIGFAAIGAYTAGLLVIPSEQKEILQPDLPGFIAQHEFRKRRRDADGRPRGGDRRRRVRDPADALERLLPQVLRRSRCS